MMRAETRALSCASECFQGEVRLIIFVVSHAHCWEEAKAKLFLLN